MGQRITLNKLGQKIDWLNRVTGRCAPEPVYGLEIAYGGYKIVLRTKEGTEADISPRGTAKETYQRLSAMMQVLSMEACRIRAEA